VAFVLSTAAAGVVSTVGAAAAGFVVSTVASGAVGGDAFDYDPASRRMLTAGGLRGLSGGAARVVFAGGSRGSAGG
jgi:hypothetical protein